MPAKKKNQNPGKQDPLRMSFWIANALHDARRRRDVTEDQMATSLGVDLRTITRLEEGKTMGRDIDLRVAGYAYVLGIEDPRDLWDEAIDTWIKKGAPLVFQPIEGPEAAFAEAIRAGVLRTLGGNAVSRRVRNGRRRAS